MMNLKNKVFTTLLTLSLSALSQAGNFQEIKSLSKEESQIPVTRVQKQFVLQEQAQDIPRISMTLVDNGGSTDVSPWHSVYLSFFQDGEMNNVHASFYLTNNFKLVDFSHVAGKSLTLKIIGDTPNDFGNPNSPVKTITFYYQHFLKEFSKKAIQAQNSGEWGDTWIEGFIQMDY